MTLTEAIANIQKVSRPADREAAIAVIVMAAVDGRLVEMPRWMPFPGPTLDRVMLAGWQPRNGNVAGYWWYQEGVTDAAGVPIRNRRATIWCPLVPPPFPAPPEAAP